MFWFTMAFDPPSAGAIGTKDEIRCPCDSKMSSQTYDFHSICNVYCGKKCNFEDRCDECIKVSEELRMCVKHQKVLKLRSSEKPNVKIKMMGFWLSLELGMVRL